MRLQPSETSMILVVGNYDMVISKLLSAAEEALVLLKAAWAIASTVA
jgi:hypothetical protein